MLVWAIIATILLGVSVYVIINLFKKLEGHEDELETSVDYYERILDEILKRIEFIQTEFKKIDKRGSFEADDEVGFYFKELKRLNELLTEFLNQ